MHRRAAHDRELARLGEQHAVLAPQLAVLLPRPAAPRRVENSAEHPRCSPGAARRRRAPVDREVDGGDEGRLLHVRERGGDPGVGERGEQHRVGRRAARRARIHGADVRRRERAQLELARNAEVLRRARALATSAAAGHVAGRSSTSHSGSPSRQALQQPSPRRRSTPSCSTRSDSARRRAARPLDRAATSIAPAAGGADECRVSERGARPSPPATSVSARVASAATRPPNGPR